MTKRNAKQTSPKVAKVVSAALRDGRSGSRTKTLEASALSQARPRKK